MDNLTDIYNDFINDGTKAFQDTMLNVGMKAWDNIVDDIEGLEVNIDNQVVNSTNNKNIVSNTIPLEIQRAKDTAEYTQALDELKTIFNPMRDATIEYYQNEHGKVNDSVLRMSKGLVTTMKNDIDLYLGQEYFKKDVIDPAINSIFNHISNNSTINAIKSDMQHRIENRFYSFSITKSQTMIMQFARRLNDMFAKSYDLVFIKYDGGKIDTTRDFCKARIKESGGYYHIEEVRNFPRDYAPWEGMIPNTDRGSIFTNLGGFNCRHTLIYVEASEVPNNVIQRAKEKGYY